MSPSVRRLLSRAAATVLGLAFALLALEGFYRVLRVRGLSPTTNPSYVRHDAELGWSYVPNAQERHASEEFDVLVRINERGFRGRSWGAKVPGRPRVLVLGDSFAFGWGVEEEQRFSERLEELEPGWEVVNAAVSGYGTDQQLLLLERLLPDVRPDLVVVVFCENDLFESGASVVYGKHKPWVERADGRLEVRGVPVPFPALERASYLWRAVVKGRWQRSFARRRRDPDREWRLVCDLYRAMERRLGDVPVVLVSTERRLADLAREEPGIHHIDLSRLLSASGGGVQFPLDGHWTPPAHAAIASELHESLRPLLP